MGGNERLGVPAATSDLSVIVPTFNERDNVDPLVEVLERALAGRRWEVVFVDDDSPDGTADRVRALAASKPHVRCLQRIGRRGLSSAVIEGMLSSSAPYLAVIDGDLQHDARVLPRMLDALETQTLDIAVGSRYAPGGGLGQWNSGRARMSRLATRVSRLVLAAELSDPMSGFFMIRRSAFDLVVRRLSGTGYKILLDVFASAPRPLRFLELPYEFGQRRAGESKLDTAVLWEYLLLLLDKLLGGRVPARFISFGLVGTTGLAVHFAVLTSTLKFLGASFVVSQSAATVVAMTTNFLLNNALTYSDRRLKGVALLKGMLSFYFICMIGGLANVGVANFVFERQYSWWAAGIAGVVVGTVWNYAMSALFTWSPRKSPR